MGLDQDDTIVRRRLAQKLEFLVQDLVEVSPPTEEELAEYFETHAESYREPDRITFSHVFVDPDRRGERTLEDAATIREALERLEDPAKGAKELGDPFMLQSYYPERNEAQIAKLFGREFAARVGELSESSGTILPDRGKCSSRSTASSKRATTRPAYASESLAMNSRIASMSSTAWVVHRSLVTRHLASERPEVTGKGAEVSRRGLACAAPRSPK